jgi:hypothetical protein
MIDGHRVVEFLDAVEANGDLGVDDRVDDERRRRSRLGEATGRPLEPLRVFGQDVEEDVAVDQNLTASRPSGIIRHGSGP